MPGVPSYRGCDECHRRKRKCDQASPACARCVRLNIPCVGKGQLRYQFKPQMMERDTTSTVALATKTTTKPVSNLKQDYERKMIQQHRHTTRIPRQIPSNEVGLLAAAFSSLLVVTDPNYDLTCFGDWFASVPLRLGASEVLDAAAAMFIQGLTELRARRGERTVAALAKYGHALKSLQEALRDPAKVKSPNTLGSIFLIVLSQRWYSKMPETQISHTRGIEYMLNASAGEVWKDELEAGMRLSMVIPTSFEAIINPSIQLDPWYYSQHKPLFGPHQFRHGKHCFPTHTLDFLINMDLPGIVRRPEIHLEEMHAAYRRLRLEWPFAFKHVTNEIEDLAKPCKRIQTSTKAHPEGRHVSLLCHALILNAFLLAFDPLNSSLHVESIELAREAIVVSRDLASRVPACTKIMPAGLFAAWVASNDLEIIESIKTALVECNAFAINIEYVRMFRALKRKINNLKEGNLAAMDVGKHVLNRDALWDVSFGFDWGFSDI